MTCFSPVRAFRAVAPNKRGRRPIVFSRRESGSDESVSISCGQCIGCRLERSRQWAMRCMHEASLYDDNCFVTLTYNDANLPVGGTLVRRDLQLFLKRLRKFSVKRRGRGFRFYACGEYGDETFRPHFHVLLFDYNFRDRYTWRRSVSGNKLSRSEELERLWSVGSSEIGDVTFQSAGYVARYCVKKVVGRAAAEHYLRYDCEGRPYQLLPEFAAMSLKPGIGRPWLLRFQADVYPHDFVIVNGRKVKPPRFYDKYLESVDPDAYDVMIDAREPDSSAEWVRRVAESTKDRLRVKEEVAASRLATFVKRGL